MQEEMMYNSTQLDDENVEVIDLEKIKPLNDTECKHETLVPDPDDTLENGAVYYGCWNQKCGRGFYILPSPK